MKQILMLMISVYLLSPGFDGGAQVTFNKGINLTNWFQTDNPRQIQFTKFTKQDFENIKSLGCDVIRLPINLFSMTSGSPDYKIDTLFLGFLDQAVDWAEELNLYLILDNHSSYDFTNESSQLPSILIKVWGQMAAHYKERSTYVVYEIMNEPNGISTQTWGNIQQAAIDAIREVDTTHTIVVGASNWNTYNDLKLLPQYSDKKLIYTFHFYDPFLFTHQGATWVSPSLADLHGVPFPYVADSMPALPAEYNGTWIADSYNGYHNDGTVTNVHKLIDIADSFKTDRNVPVYCGELGAYMLYSRDTDRVYWYSEVRKYLEEKGIPWTSWDYQGGFGLFKKGSNELFDYDLNIPLVHALGFNIPPQQVFEIKPDSVGFSIYRDYIGENIAEASNASGGTIDFYSGDQPNNDHYCIHWTGGAQYAAIGFNFVPDRDLSVLKNENYALALLVRGNKPGSSFDVRFLDTKTSDPNDHPWRMNYVIDESVAQWDSKWHKVYIPLSSFMDMGSWDNNTWYNPIGAFDWTAIDQFEIVAEHEPLTNIHFWFDNITITNQDTAQIYDHSVITLPASLKQNSITTLVPFSIYPNPAKEWAIVDYTLKDQENVSICIYNLSGQKIKTIINARQSSGEHAASWKTDSDNGGLVPEGMYMCLVQVSGRTYASLVSVIR